MPAHVTAPVIVPPAGRTPGLGAPAGQAPGDLFAMLMGMIDQGDASGLEVSAQFAAVPPKPEPAVPRQGLPGVAPDTAVPGPTDAEGPAGETLALDLAPAIPQAATAGAITTGVAPTGPAPQSPPPSAPIQTAQAQTQPEARAQAQANLAQQAQATEAAPLERPQEAGAQRSAAVPSTSDTGVAGLAGKPVDSRPGLADTATSTPPRTNQAAASAALAASPSPPPAAQAAPAPIPLAAANPSFKASDGPGAGGAPVEPDVSAPPPSIAAQAAAQASLGQPAAKTTAKPGAASKTGGGEASPAANPSGQPAAPALARAAVPAAPAPAPAAFVGDGKAALDDAVVLATADAADGEAVLDREAPRGASTQLAAGGTAPGAAPPTAAPATAGTVSHLAAQMLQRLDGRATRFDIQLDPAGLGRVNVQLNIDTRGRLTAALTFERPDSAEALKARSGELRQALEEAGFDLPEDSLSFQSDLDRRSTEDRRGEQQADPHGRGRAFDAAAETADQIDQGLSPAQRRRGARGLDIRI